jgi:hypothetical protein
MGHQRLVEEVVHRAARFRDRLPEIIGGDTQTVSMW